ncbi:hypothetical protein WJX84_005982 [Apatococcus fuscideae]|uniref:Uncharacterized protein n=1 Tax=Apatococcus fuscideae TaxID=2026836 RepID=A0AAW1SYI2_9CHLO
MVSKESPKAERFGEARQPAPVGENDGGPDAGGCPAAIMQLGPLSGSTRGESPPAIAGPHAASWQRASPAALPTMDHW